MANAWAAFLALASPSQEEGSVGDEGPGRSIPEASSQPLSPAVAPPSSHSVLGALPRAGDVEPRLENLTHDSAASAEARASDTEEVAGSVRMMGAAESGTKRRGRPSRLHHLVPDSSAACATSSASCFGPSQRTHVDADNVLKKGGGLPFAPTSLYSRPVTKHTCFSCLICRVARS